jgi:two-component system sensor histidine kinase/response regulator
MKPSAVDGGTAALAAIEAAERAGHPFSLIVTDALMPHMDGYRLSEEIRRRYPSKQTRILMLTSRGQRGDAQRCHELGISAYLLKPVMKSDLQNAILTLFGRGRSTDGVVLPLVTRHMLHQPSRTLHILVAEDNAVNQVVILRILEKMGHTSVLAQNGKEALALTTSQKFDLVFMDVQMPEMDGLAATKAIRHFENTTGIRLPIFAMTAHAMKGDRERCLDAGMDGYITKPIRFSDIEKTLLSIPNTSPTLSAVATPTQRPSASGKVFWSKANALERVGGDENLLQEICQMFLTESPKLIQKMRDGIASNDSESVMRTAHTLKGELGYMGIDEAVQAVVQLEKMGREGDLSQAGEMLNLLDRLLGKLYVAIKEPAGAIL